MYNNIVQLVNSKIIDKVINQCKSGLLLQLQMYDQILSYGISKI